LKIKIGLGYDIHRLQTGRKLCLGGIELDFPKGLSGHSDGDCLIHAVIDALLGAMGEGDIGQMFPDADPRYKDIRSTELLKQVVEMCRGQGWQVVHIDSVIIAERPKISSSIGRMKQALCPLLHINEKDLGIKAKTNEGMGLIGEGEAIASFAQALIRSR
jgi:2-C-methyl-D-erythritol 2,4-cyclodiphosphate synthase